MKRALYAGSFDPITRGHLDIVEKALETFDAVQIAVAKNGKKSRLFEQGQALLIMNESIEEHFGTKGVHTPGTNFHTFLDGRLETDVMNIPLTRHARAIGASHLVRGLRQSSDFDDEFTLHGVAERIDPGITMVHFIAKAEFLHVSSSTARELASIGEDVDWLVTPSVAAWMKGRYFPEDVRASHQDRGVHVK